MRPFSSAALVLLVLAAPAFAGVQVDLLSGNSVRGTLDSAGEAEVFTIDVPSGAVLGLNASGAKRGPAVDVRITDDTGALVVSDKLKEKKKGFAGKVTLARGGAYRIEVSSRDGATAGAYALRVSWKSPRTFTVAPPAESDAGSVAFSADGGALVRARVSAAKGSEVIPRITRISGPQGFEVLFGAAGKAASDSTKNVRAPFTGAYTLHYANDGAAGAVAARISIRQPRASKARFDVTTAALGVVGEGGGSALGVVAAPDQPTTLTVGDGLEGSDPLNGIAGASVAVPPGALRKATGVLVGTAASLVLPAGSDEGLFVAGPAVLFGTARLAFAKPVEITLPAAVEVGQTGVVVFRSFKGAVTAVTDGVQIADGHVTVAVRRFGVYQAFGPAGAAPAESKLIGADTAAVDNFGCEVAIDGDTAVVGSRFDDDGGSDSGSVYVFLRGSSGVWTQSAKLTASDPGVDDRFGTSLALDGDTLLVGAWSSSQVGVQSGSVYVFMRGGGGAWTQQAELTPSDAAEYDLFGYSVALDGDTAVIGSIFDKDAGLASGSAYVFTRSGAGAWSEQAKLRASDAAAFNKFGISVSVNGDTAIVGAYIHDDEAAGVDSGAAYVFVRNVSGQWSEQSKLMASDAAASDLFGISVAVFGDTAVVGAMGDDDGGAESGAAYVFTRDGAGNWTEDAKLVASDAAAADQFGSDVALHGSRVLIGAYRDDDAGTDSGAAYLFTSAVAGVWTEQRKLTASDGTAGAAFGVAVALDADTVLIGAQWDPEVGTSAGAAYVVPREP